VSDLNLALIGNCGYSALIDGCGDVVWTCLPAFDSDPVFCSLLQGEPDEDPRGIYRIELMDFVRAEQRYLDQTAILSTTLYDRYGGAVELTDFAPRFKQFGRSFRPVMLARSVRPVAGSPRIRVRLRPAFDYGASRCRISFGSHHIRYLGPDHVLRLTTDASITAILDETPFLLEREINLLLGPDETVGQSVAETTRHLYEQTRAYWRDWVRHLMVPLEWQEAVIRAAITLKLSAFEDSGAIVAAMTTSIPEAPHSGRNWDYRYCWLRDAYFVVEALNRLGATRTMENYLYYIINIAANSQGRPLQPVYRINGTSQLDETTVETLTGYRGMGPVRVGNQAFSQIQNDVYGAAILAAPHVFFDERMDRPGDVGLFRRLEVLGEAAARVHDRPDAGLWELRGTQRVHTFSAVMCWAACDRLARIAARLDLPGRRDYWRARADGIHATICEQAWNERRGSFVESFGGEHMDASLLLLRELGFLRADDPRFAGTVAAIEAELRRGDFLFRYVKEDDFGHPETAFTICTFWYINALATLGRTGEARELFEHMLSCRNRHGLLSEDLAPATGELWGNFPQTYSMVGLINCATRLSRPWEEAF